LDFELYFLNFSFDLIHLQSVVVLFFIVATLGSQVVFHGGRVEIHLREAFVPLGLSTLINHPIQC
jgi:hypothetical protein